MLTLRVASFTLIPFAKYKVFTLIGNKLRRDPFSLSIQLFGSQASTEIHDLCINSSEAIIGKEIEVSFYDRPIGDILRYAFDYGNSYGNGNVQL